MTILHIIPQTVKQIPAVTQKCENPQKRPRPVVDRSLGPVGKRPFCQKYGVATLRKVKESEGRKSRTLTNLGLEGPETDDFCQFLSNGGISAIGDSNTM
jgi:hypothetical protein